MEMEGKGRVRMGGSNEDPSTTERERRKRRWEGQEGRVGRGNGFAELVLNRLCACAVVQRMTDTIWADALWYLMSHIELDFLV